MEKGRKMEKNKVGKKEVHPIPDSVSLRIRHEKSPDMGYHCVPYAGHPHEAFSPAEKNMDTSIDRAELTWLTWQEV